MKKRCTGKMKGVIISCVSCFLVSYSFLFAGSFRIDINDVSGLDTPWPLVASIPFLEGEITDASAIRITGGGMEVPSQIDVAARWRDGSIRWALGGFTASPQGEYTVEYGEGIKRGVHAAPLKVSRRGGGFVVNTGAAEYRFDADKLLPESGYMVAGGSRIEILRGSGDGASLVDNSGRRGVVSGAQAEVENEVLKEGPGRFVVKRSGYYVSGEGERLARAEAWFYFAAGSPYVRITHRIIFTENTNDVWFKDYGLEFKTPVSPHRVFCALGEPGKEDIREVNAQGGEVYLLQDQYRHFAEREDRAVIGISEGGEDRVIEEFAVAGEWAHGDYGGWGLTISMPWLAERFPKELSFGDGRARAVLWSGRSKRELDFRVATLMKEYWQFWRMRHATEVPPSYASLPSNAQGGARTHDVWLLPHAGSYDEQLVRRAAVAGARTPLAMADTVWLCATEAMGYPMLHKETERFAEEEAMISELWDRFILPLQAFPMTGFISWGCYPSRNYFVPPGSRILANPGSLETLREYGVRREPWRHYARSGERRYYDLGHRFSRFTGDWYICHRDVPNSYGDKIPNSDKKRGGFIGADRRELYALPMFWGTRTDIYGMNAGDIGHWLLDYYLTGDESSLDLLKMVKESFKNHWDVEAVKRNPHYSAMTIRVIVTLAVMNWDEDAMRMAKEVVDNMVDLSVQNGFNLFGQLSTRPGGYGSQYKDARTSHNIVEYYLATRDELAKEAFLKLIDQRYRFDRREVAVSYKNYDAFTYSLAYFMTGDARYRAVAEQAVRDMFYYTKSLPLSEELKAKGEDPLNWKDLFHVTPLTSSSRQSHLSHASYHNPFIGLPTALKLIAEKGWSGKTTPLIVKPKKDIPGQVLFEHSHGRETRFGIQIQTDMGRVPSVPEVVPYASLLGGSGGRVAGIEAEFEKQMPLGPWFAANPESYPHLFLSGTTDYNATITVPPETPGGLYLLSLEEAATFTVLDSSSDKVSLYCPEGFWSIFMGDTNADWGRSGEGMPAYFRVPAGLETLEVFAGLPVRIRRSDGSVALDMADDNVGRLSVPVQGKSGVWSVEFYIQSIEAQGSGGVCAPTFIKLLNVEPVVAFGSPALVPDKVGSKAIILQGKAVPPEGPFEFIPGVESKAVRLSSGEKLVFPRGEKLLQGGYSFFPGTKGTVEFWFRAERSTQENPLKQFQEVKNVFVRAPHMNFYHRYFIREPLTPGHRRGVFRLLSLLIGELVPESGNPQYGFEGLCYFNGGEWMHIAYTWEMKEGENGWEGENLNIFLNGRLISGKIGQCGINRFTGKQKFALSEKGEDIILGPFEGSMDMLRISDVVRYKEDFELQRKAFEMDEHTRALFLFDGDFKGASAFSGVPLNMKLE